MSPALPAPALALPGPALGICGFSGAGKTTLLEALIPRLLQRGLRVAVIKHDAHGLEVDRPGKDSARLFAAGADVQVSGPEQGFSRRHQPGILHTRLNTLLGDHDLVLVEGHKQIALPKLWLLGPGEAEAPDAVPAVLKVLPRDSARAEAAWQFVERWLAEAWLAPPLLGGLLIGGASSRMGQPKQLVSVDGVALVERVHSALRAPTRQVVALGAGALPPALDALPRLADPPGVAGPLAGLLAAQRWAPRAAWLVASCDLPRLDAAALDWLLAQRAPGRWAVLSCRDGRVEPLLAVYEPQARGLLEDLADRCQTAPRLLRDCEGVYCPELPEALAPAWKGVNTPAELQNLIDQG